MRALWFALIVGALFAVFFGVVLYLLNKQGRI